MSRICFRLLLLDGAYFNFKDMLAIAVLDRAYFSFRTCMRWTWPKGIFLFCKGDGKEDQHLLLTFVVVSI